jgi:hypothetical protein
LDADVAIAVSGAWVHRVGKVTEGAIPIVGVRAADLLARPVMQRFERLTALHVAVRTEVLTPRLVPCSDGSRDRRVRGCNRVEGHQNHGATDS